MVMDDAALVEGRSMLIVDDERDIRKSMQRLIATALHGLQVDVAESGDAALEMLDGASYDIVASDFRMPGMDGVEFLTEVKTRLPGAFRVMMTAFPEKEVAQRAASDAEVETFFSKPVDPMMVIATVKDLLGRRAG